MGGIIFSILAKYDVKDMTHEVFCTVLCLFLGCGILTL